LADLGRPLYADDFAGDLSQWVVEQQPGGSVQAHGGKMVIDDADGCTVWFRPKLRGPIVISYEATVSGESRVADLNCFWMASDPLDPDNLFRGSTERRGKFSRYDPLRAYYVGCGGSGNTTTRFRRYAGLGCGSSVAQQDLRDPHYLLEPNRPYQIQIVSDGDRVQFIRDGEVVFDINDPSALHEGWFGFRTVNSRVEIRRFRVYAPTPPAQEIVASE
jgi:hypothetical protein